MLELFISGRAFPKSRAEQVRLPNLRHAEPWSIAHYGHSSFGWQNVDCVIWSTSMTFPELEQPLLPQPLNWGLSLCHWAASPCQAGSELSYFLFSIPSFWVHSATGRTEVGELLTNRFIHRNPHVQLSRSSSNEPCLASQRYSCTLRPCCRVQHPRKKKALTESQALGVLPLWGGEVGQEDCESDGVYLLSPLGWKFGEQY